MAIIPIPVTVTVFLTMGHQKSVSSCWAKLISSAVKELCVWAENSFGQFEMLTVFSIKDIEINVFKSMVEMNVPNSINSGDIVDFLDKRGYHLKQVS